MKAIEIYKNSVSKIKQRLFIGWVYIAKFFGPFTEIPVCLSGGIKRNHLLLIGMPRSGSSWLGRLLAAHPDFHYHFEPLNPTYSKVVFENYGYRFDPEMYPELKIYLDRISRGHLFGWMSVLYQPPWRFFQSNRILVKDVHALFSLSLLNMNNFDAVLLLRHPCAVAQSHISRGLVPSLEKYMEGLKMDPHVSDLCTLFEKALSNASSNNSFYRLGVFWELGYSLALRDLQPNQTTFIRYEDFCAKPLECLEQIADRHRFKLTLKMRNMIVSSMNPTVPGYTRRKTEDVVNVWREKMCPEDQCRVLEGVQAMGSCAFNHWYNT